VNPSLDVVDIKLRVERSYFLYESGERPSFVQLLFEYDATHQNHNRQAPNPENELAA
jgi:hypothetical protein